jgi:hypothetical protein
MGEEIAIHVLEPVGDAKYGPRHPERSKQSGRIPRRYPKVIPRDPSTPLGMTER